MVCDDGLHGSSPHARRKSLRRLASTRGFKPRATNEYGWIRVFEGLQPFAANAPSKLVKVTLNTTVEDINSKLGFGEELTLWLQIGREKSRRLERDEYPLRIQEHFLVTHGWASESRRQRLAVDPELQYSLQWCAGPADRHSGTLKSGTIYILKGHVFPQWKPRPAHIIGSRLHSFGMHQILWTFIYLVHVLYVYDSIHNQLISKSFNIFRIVMGNDRVKRRNIRIVPTKSAEARAVRESLLPGQPINRRCGNEPYISWFQYCLGTQHVVLLAKRGKNIKI
jgi:hypothetical protein